jgi:hypothetical protein
MKLANQVVGCRQRRMSAVTDRREGRANMVLIVPRVFQQPTFLVPIVQISPRQRLDPVPAKDDIFTAPELFIADNCGV